MKVASGLLLALWLVFMWFKVATVEPNGLDGELIRILSITVVLLQSIAWCFAFTKPSATLVVLLITEAAAVFLTVTVSTVYTLHAVVNLIFILLTTLAVTEKRKNPQGG